MTITLDKVKHQGEKFCEYNRYKPIAINQYRTICLIESHVDDQFLGDTMGEAWDFIDGYAGKTITNKYGKEIEFLKGSKKPYELEEWEKFYSDNLKEIEENTPNFQDDYFNKRYEAMRKGENWDADDRIFEESTEELFKEKTEILYDVNKDDEQFD